MTNGEVITAAFPEARVNRNGFIVECSLKAFSFSVEESWWDAEYEGPFSTLVPKGTWFCSDIEHGLYRCSTCGYDTDTRYEFCPNCHTDMQI